MKINNPGIGASGRGELVIVIAVKVGFYTPKIHKADAPPQLTVRFSPDMSIAEMQMVINATIHNIGVIYQFEGGQYSEDTSVYFNGGTNMSIIVQDKQRVRNQWLYGMDKTDAEMGDIPGWTKGCSQFVPPVVHPDIMAMINYVEGRDDNGSTISDFAKGVPSKKRTYRRYEPLPRVTVPFTEGVPYEWPKIEYTDVTVDELIGGGQSLEDWLGKQIAQWRKNRGPSMQERWEEQWDQLTCPELMTMHTPFMNVKELNDSWCSRIIRNAMRPGMIGHGGMPSNYYSDMKELQAANLKAAQLATPCAIIKIPDGYEFLNGKVAEKRRWWERIVTKLTGGRIMFISIARWESMDKTVSDLMSKVRTLETKQHSAEVKAGIQSDWLSKLEKASKEQARDILVVADDVGKLQYGEQRDLPATHVTMEIRNDKTGEVCGICNLGEILNMFLDHLGMEIKHTPSKAETLKLVPVKKAAPAKKKK